MSWVVCSWCGRTLAGEEGERVDTLRAGPCDRCDLAPIGRRRVFLELLRRVQGRGNSSGLWRSAAVYRALWLAPHVVSVDRGEEGAVAWNERASSLGASAAGSGSAGG